MNVKLTHGVINPFLYFWEIIQLAVCVSEIYWKVWIFRFLSESIDKYLNSTKMLHCTSDFDTLTKICSLHNNKLFIPPPYSCWWAFTLILRIFAGAFCDQKICEGCPHRYERDEKFMSLNLEIKSGNLQVVIVMKWYMKKGHYEYWYSMHIIPT